MKKNDNLDIANAKSSEEKRKRAQKAQRASTEAKRRRKSLKECMAALIKNDVSSNERIKEKLRIAGIEDDEYMTYGAAVSVVMLNKALGGNVRAAEFIRDTAGENVEHELKKLASKRDYELRKQELELKKEEFEHKKKMDEIRIGKGEVDKADPSELMSVLENLNVFESES